MQTPRFEASSSAFGMAAQLGSTAMQIDQYKADGLAMENEVFEAALDRLGERRKIDDVYCFVKLPDNRMWRPFMGTARNIHSLEVDKSYLHVLQVLFNMARVHQCYPFPNLQSFKWTAQSNRDLIDLTAFIVPTLVTFVLQLHDLPPQFLYHVYTSLTRRIHTLQCLRIGLPDHVQIVPQTAQILTNLLTAHSASLTAVQIPKALIIPPIVNCLSRMPNLCAMSIGFIASHIDSDQYTLPANRALPSLRHFSYRGSAQILYNTIFDVINFSYLSTFSWHLDLEDGLDNMREFIRFVVRCCPRLTKLTLGDSNMYMLDRCFPQFVSWAAIQDLLQCRDLTTLSIHCVQVDMSRTELSDLLRSRTTWKKLEIYTSLPLKFQDLFLFGQHCPVITSLGLNIIMPSPSDNVELLNVTNRAFPVTMPQLHEMDLAYSSVNPALCSTIGRFLHKISRHPVYVSAWDQEVSLGINQAIVSLYKEEAARTRRPFSHAVREYIDTVMSDAENMEEDFDDSGDSDDD